MRLTPTSLTERVDGLDFLRGIALLGIFIANMLHFHSPSTYIDPYTWYTVPSEQAAFHFIDVFVEASFYPLFAMLFGYGLNMQYEKSLKNNSQFAPFMARRMSVLLVFGLIHGLLIWFGDVLFTYAVMGFIMIAAVRIPRKWLVTIALALYIIPTAALYVLLKIVRMADPDSVLDGYVDIQQIELAISAYAHGTWGEIFKFRAGEFLISGVGNSLLGVVIILPLIMLGAAFSKYKMVERSMEMKKKLLVTMIVFITAGVVLKNIPFLTGPKFEDIMITQTLFGGPVLTIGYAALLLLLWHIPFLKIVTKPFTAVGRMALTTYILQSVIATLIFYSYGAGLYGKVDVLTGTWLAVGIFAIQVIFANLWLSKFRMGPLEFIWRKFSYGKNLPNKEEKVQDLS